MTCQLENRVCRSYWWLLVKNHTQYWRQESVCHGHLIGIVFTWETIASLQQWEKSDPACCCEKKMIKCCNSNGVNNVFQKAVLKLNGLYEPFISVLYRKKKLLWITEYCLFLGSLGLFTIFVLISTFSRFMGFLLVWILAFTEHVKGKQKKGRGKGSQKSLLLHDLNFF